MRKEGVEVVEITLDMIEELEHELANYQTTCNLLAATNVTPIAKQEVEVQTWEKLISWLKLGNIEQAKEAFSKLSQRDILIKFKIDMLVALSTESVTKINLRKSILPT